MIEMAQNPDILISHVKSASAPYPFALSTSYTFASRPASLRLLSITSDQLQVSDLVTVVL